MTSDPNATQAFDNWFEEDNENGDGFASLDADGQEGISEFMDLFDINDGDDRSSQIFAEKPQASGDKAVRMTLEFESPEAELDALFTEDDDPSQGHIDPFETSSWLEIDQLMDQQDAFGTEREAPAPTHQGRNLDDAELAGLRDLLGVEMDFADFAEPPRRPPAPVSVPTPRAKPAPTPVPVAASFAEPFPVLLFAAIEDLDSLIDQAPADPDFSFAKLETLLDTPVQQPFTTLTHHPFKLPTNVDEVEDEFKDLEVLLEQADRNLGGPSVMGGVGSQRLQSRNRPSKSRSFEQTMRVPIKQLDNLSNLIGELVVKRNRLEQDQERLRQFLDNLLNQAQNLSDVGGRMQDLYERTLLEGALLASRGSNRQQSSKATYSDGRSTIPGSSPMQDQHLDALEMDRFTGFHLLSQEMIELIVRVRESASDIQYLVDETDQVARTLRQVTTQLQEGMTKSRMVPFTQTADRLPRAIREVSMKLDKKVNLEVEGGEVLIDKMILEHLYNPMTHLVNNAITHGIETPADRRKAGKPPEGKLSVRAFLQGNQTLITVSDDGAGINGDKVKQKAIEKGLITRMEAQNLSETETYDLLFQAGFSTKDQADDFSGRGVGLDVVRTSLLDIRGAVTIDSKLGQGTTFIIRLPLTLSICKALCCLSDRARIAFPMDGVEDTKDYMPSDIITDEDGQKSVTWNDTVLPLHRLGDLLNYNRQLSRSSVYGGKPEDDLIGVIIVRGSGGNLLALQVDQVIGEEEIVIKQIEGPIPKPPGIAGATVRGDGSIMPIADVLELIEIAQGRLRTDSSSGLWRKTLTPSVNEAHLDPTVLIVDDSITVRELLSLSFKKAGFRVEQARDGQEAWEQLKSGLPCDLVFCDIEMPRMNGLELLSQLQNDPELSSLPIALLTSRGADRHRKVAAKLGATGYFTKPYTEKDILDSAHRMLNGEILLHGSTRKANSQLSRFKKAKAAFRDEAPTMIENSQRTSRSTVLIIDDSVMVREMLSMTFKKADYHTETARDGQDAWEKLKSGLPCDLILCDIEMPRMNGLELLERIQDDPNISKIPIAMITSRGAQKMQRMATEKGAKGYFVKPYIEETLLEASKRLMKGDVLLDLAALSADE